MGSLTTRVVTRVSSVPATQGATYQNKGFSYDYAIGGLPFLSGIAKDRPYQRRTAPYRKDQIDQTPVPGEQSMVFWWLRSQVSFHGGSGIIFEEPALDPGVLYSDPLSAVAIPVRYQDSEGVDPFTQPGKVSLLPATVFQQAASSVIHLDGAVSSGTDLWLQGSAATLQSCTDGASTTVAWGGSGTIQSITNDGTNYYVADGVGIWEGTLPSGAGSQIWNTGTTPVVIKYVKDRLVGCIGASVYELVGTGPALPTPLFTPNAAGWTWTAIEEGPDSIFIAGYNGTRSLIYSIGLTTGVGNTPILSTPVEVAQMPTGEQVYSLKVCEGSFLAIGTNKGIRVADIGTQGRLLWGPLLVTVTSPVLSLATFDRYIYGTYTNQMTDGTSGLVVIDLGFQTQFQRFAYAKSYRTHVVGTARAVTLYGASGRLVIGVDSSGSYLAQPVGGTLEASGYLKTGNIRFHTQEKKLYKFANIQGDLTNGGIQVSITNSSGGSQTVASLTSNSSSDDFGLPNFGSLQWVNLTFTLNRSGISSSLGPVLYSYQVKALPAQKNQRYFILPLMLFDHEEDKNKAKDGYAGYAKARLMALETLEEARDNITFQDLNTNDSHLVVIDDLQFVQTVPPKDPGAMGGYVMVTLRSVT